MNKLKLLFFVFAALAFTSLSSCKKEDDAEPSKRDLLTAQTWRGDKLYMNGREITNDPYILEYSIDIKSVKLTFTKDRTYTATYTIGGEKESESGTWDFLNNEQQIDFPFMGEKADIKRLTKDNFDISSTFEEDGQKFTLEMRFIK